MHEAMEVKERGANLQEGRWHPKLHPFTHQPFLIPTTSGLRKPHICRDHKATPQMECSAHCLPLADFQGPSRNTAPPLSEYTQAHPLHSHGFVTSFGRIPLVLPTPWAASHSFTQTLYTFSLIPLITALPPIT